MAKISKREKIKFLQNIKKKVGRPTNISKLKTKIAKSKTKISTMNKKRLLAGKRSTSGKGLILKADNRQTPKTRKSVSADRKRTALPPGRRISKTGNKYTEHRQNRSDKKKSKL